MKIRLQGVTLTNEQICENAKDFIDGSGKGPRVSIWPCRRTGPMRAALINLSGADAHFALAENGELLDAFEIMLFQVYGRELDREHRFIVDAEGFQANPQSRASRDGTFRRRPGSKERPAIHIRRS